MLLFLIYGITFYLLASTSFSVAYENRLGPEYGKEWLLFVDDNGTTLKMNFSTLPSETRGLFLGKVYCYLHTRLNSDDGELLTPPNDNTEINSTYFNGSNSITAITHGWMSSGNTEWLLKLKNALLKSSDSNVIIVDWAEIARNLYPWSAFSTKYVGRYLYKVLRSLMQTYKMQNDTVHLIGHSLGAHVMGYTGMFSEGQLSRITGLDPARPLFELPLMSESWRLDASDAQFVDIIHTAGGVLGYKNSHGNSDFYPNSGKPPQPGCEGHQQMIESCSHGRSHEYFLESIYSEIGFVSYPCENWRNFRDGACRSNPTLMGYPANMSSEGDFFLFTNNASKYACDAEC